MKRSFVVPALLALFLTALMVGCGGSGNKLIGTWKQQGEHANHFLVFSSDTMGYWIFHKVDKVDSVPMRYKADFSVTPHTLDLNGWGYGPFDKRGYYGLFEFEGEDGIKVLLKPGPPNATSDTLRPKNFGERQNHYKREK